ncbi:DNA-binding SARP family transcriptional activator [Micromonospora olivasterospora]|uniref:DNA-binding SARP family transcriptional activator n=1 Tax=Micromonospora olivasterospora TaxID=1880 RepID=A0A562II13_MICOL|nr:BTAD domain-containing putative transcriptional regulator [Micromonospora olivasterospora]TWH70393.1 DNA-binding SARP family transcriptional activator [Micromonospora olivasterospora]
MGALRVGVLGPVRAERDGTPVRLGPRLVALLSVLVVEVGRPVPAARLMTLLWGDRSASAATLRSHVSHLRRALTPDPADARVLVTVGSAGSVGYQLDLPPERIDAWRFERAYDEGRRLLSDGATERAAAVFGEALALWRGPAYADVADQPFALREIARLDSMRRSVWRGHAEALCALGRYPEAVGQLVGAVADEPYDEALRRLLALALYAEQRVEEAAQVCREGLTLLRERGLDAPGLHEVQRAILRREAPPAAWPGPRAAPCLLPPEPVRFVGRTAEFERARRHLCDPMSAREALVVTGPAGVGKTTFAVRVAHTVADRFPDGQLYVNLRGFDPGGAATTPDEAVRGFLDALHVPAQRIPATLDARVGLYRSLLADRRILVVLDNARDAAQVRPLLPGAPGSAVLVTSRNQMTGLAAADGADPLVLDVLTAAEARLLLEWRLGVDRLVVEPLAVDEVVAACAGLPLALAVVAARACVHRKFPLGALAAELCTGRVGLDGFANGDAATDVRAVFSWSYRALAADAARMFRLLGLSPGPDVTVPVVASLAGLPVRRVRPLLTELCELHLVTEHAPGRYTFHDLLRAYATELAHTVDTPADRDAAQHRLVGHYLGTAHRAARLLAPHRDGIPAPAAARRWRPRSSPTTPRRWPGSPPSARRCWASSNWRSAPASTRTPGSWPGPSTRSSTTGGTGTTGPRRSGPRWRRRGGLGTVPGRPPRTAASASSTPSWAGSTTASSTSGRHWSGTPNWATSSAGRTRTGAWAGCATSGATGGMRSSTTNAPWRCTGRPATGPDRPWR